MNEQMLEREMSILRKQLADEQDLRRYNAIKAKLAELQAVWSETFVSRRTKAFE